MVRRSRTRQCEAEWPREKGREVLFFFFGLRFLGLELCPIQDRLCSRRPSRRCQNRDCWGRGRRSVLRLGERSESSPDSMITSLVPTTVKHALAQGHFVTAVARRPERLSSADRLSFVRGDVLSPGGLTGALDGVESVISCIGPEKNLSPGTLMSVGVASILTECKRANVRRFIM